jgi:hypothetical protein
VISRRSGVRVVDRRFLGYNEKAETGILLDGCVKKTVIPLRKGFGSVTAYAGDVNTMVEPVYILKASRHRTQEVLK